IRQVYAQGARGVREEGDDSAPYIGLMNESDAGGISEVLAAAGGDGGHDHADDAQDVGGEDDEDADPAGEDEEGADDGVEGQADLEVDGLAAVVVDEGGPVALDEPHDQGGDDRDQDVDGEEAEVGEEGVGALPLFGVGVHDPPVRGGFGVGGWVGHVEHDRSPAVD